MIGSVWTESLAKLALFAIVIGTVFAVGAVRSWLARRREHRARLARLDKIVEDNRPKFRAMGIDVRRDGRKLHLVRDDKGIT